MFLNESVLIQREINKNSIDVSDRIEPLIESGYLFSEGIIDNAITGFKNLFKGEDEKVYIVKDTNKYTKFKNECDKEVLKLYNDIMNAIIKDNELILSVSSNINKLSLDQIKQKINLDKMKEFHKKMGDNLFKKNNTIKENKVADYKQYIINKEKFTLEDIIYKFIVPLIVNKFHTKIIQTNELITNTILKNNDEVYIKYNMGNSNVKYNYINEEKSVDLKKDDKLKIKYIFDSMNYITANAASIYQHAFNDMYYFLKDLNLAHAGIEGIE